MGMTRKDRDQAHYWDMRAEGQTHEQCVDFFRNVGIDIDHVLSLSPAQRHFGENWVHHTLVTLAVALLVGVISWLVN